MKRLLSVPVVVLSLAAPTLARPALVVADGVGGPEDVAVREALRAAGVDALPPTETVAIVEAAAASGVACSAGDVACWQAVATLADADDVVLVTAAEVVMAGRTGVKRSVRLRRDVAGIAPAVGRLLGTVGAVVVEVAPSASVRFDETPVEGGIADGLTPGPHEVSAVADGFVERRATVMVVAGEVVREQWTLEPVATSEGGGLATPLLHGGVGAVGLGVAAGVTIGSIGFLTNRCFFAGALPKCPVETIDTARAWDVTAIAVGGGLGLLGVGAIVASTLVEEGADDPVRQ